MRLLLVSTYELGHQPIHLALPAAELSAAGIEIETLDLTVGQMDQVLLDRVDAVAFSVPMHTAMRLATDLALKVRQARPELPVAFYGLYAAVGREWTVGPVADLVIAGEYVTELVAWARALAEGRVPRSGVVVNLERSAPVIPDRSMLPPHEGYARLEWGGESRLAAAVEATHGCRHRCRHCPIPVVYDGRIRLVGLEPVLGDIEQLVAGGVRHVTFSDPDFMNAPRYSLDVLGAAHAAHPELTFDVTVKVEHVLAHRTHWPEMSELGVLFVVSAFESVDEDTLGILDKNHTVDDMSAAVRILREAGIHVRPTWLPFLPWTHPGDLARLVEFLDRHELWSATDPVQLAIKLLIPEGSLLEGHPAVTPFLSGYEPEALTWAWEFEHAGTELLHKELDVIAAEASDGDTDRRETLVAMRMAIGHRSGVDLGPLTGWGPAAPRLTESWFCCAEPTTGQATAVALSIGRVLR
ncbi:MAG: radical SAM protein [Actinomycetota bacterium]|nr:radical SAM protein [Actinomycetota bacterium]